MRRKAHQTCDWMKLGPAAQIPAELGCDLFSRHACEDRCCGLFQTIGYGIDGRCGYLLGRADDGQTGRKPTVGVMDRNGNTTYCEFLFFVNNDMRFEPDCVGRLALALAADDTLFAVDPTQRSWDGARVIHGRTRFVPGSYHDVVVPPWAVEYTATAAAPVEVPWGCAGSLLVRRDRFGALDGFDPTFFIDFEDTDLCWRAWRRGWRTIHVPGAVLYHKVGMSGDEYQHLIRGVAPAQVPKFWFRRRVSYHTNLLRFGLKVLPARDAARLMAALVARIAWHVSRRNLKLALSIVLAFAHNARRLPDTLAARRRVRDGARHDHAAVVRRFTAP